MKTQIAIRWIGSMLVSFSLLGSAAPASDTAHHGGYTIFNQFNVAPEGTVIRLPQSAASGDLLWIRPLRLNPDEYLVLQKCSTADCSRAEVVRAWNTAGTMGPLTVTSNKIRIEADARYMIFMQRIPVRGGGTFPQYQVDSAPLVFIPTGPARLFLASDVKGSEAKGLQRITRSAVDGSQFTATFEGGSVVRLKVLRPQD